MDYEGETLNYGMIRRPRFAMKRLKHPSQETNRVGSAKKVNWHTHPGV
jgi:hypothetical protein